MSTARISKSAIATAFFLLTVAACDSGVRAPISGPAQASVNEPRSLEWYEARPGVLRARMDSARGRIWTLRAEGVDLYDANSDAKLRSIALPEWFWVGELYSCPPDLAIGPRGDVIVSSNVTPILWRIDAATFQVTRHELEVDEDKGKDIGFSGMTYSAQQGAFLAMNGLDGSLWRIDRYLRRAQHIPLSTEIRGACSLSVRSGVAAKSRSGALCVQTEERQWTVYLAPDYRSGYAHPAPCSTGSLAPTAELRTSQNTF